VNSCISAVTFSNISKLSVVVYNPLMRGFIVKFLDKSIKMLSVTVLVPFIILVGKYTGFFKLYIANRGTAVAQWLRYCATYRKVRFQMVSLEFFIDIILLIALWPWGRLSL
jgi:hypothetical protein